MTTPPTPAYPNLPAAITEAMAGFLAAAARAGFLPRVSSERLADAIQTSFRLAAALALVCPEYLAAIGREELALAARCPCALCRAEPLPDLLRRGKAAHPITGGGADDDVR